MNKYDWLPELVLFEKYGNDWDKYLEALYEFYIKDFIDTKPIFRCKILQVKRLPQEKGKDATFWHIIQKGKSENEKIPDLRRCERIRWPKPIIEHCDENIANIKIWENKRHKNGIQRSICIWFDEKAYLVILRRRRGYILFWTAYPVTEAHQKRKLMQEYNGYKNKQAPP